MQRVLEPEAMDTAEEADAYAAMDHREANEAFVARLFALGASGRMLDIGTGPGQIPLLVCARDPAARVLGIDLSENMLRHARCALAASPFAARIEYRRGDAKALALPEASFDTVYSNTILHHIPEPTPFLREARRVLRSGGVLLIRDLFRPATREAAEALVERHAGDATDAQRALFRDSLCAALTPEELRATADAAGLGDAELSVDTDRHMSLQLRAAPGGA
ncbi:MAG: class I SAM-dependent methyltransferase [Myxococcales bacterium]|nr:class I SAM-dependent methyltransferase [Myxococcales bacterium]MDH5306058.1 class I SAM-dependent methyltransferase [Myxococcales bacterium]MDH5565997.1 class I SAM-dependent methyltransferase [Myxococcales bacterium]